MLIDTGNRLGTFASKRWARANLPNFYVPTSKLLPWFKHRGYEMVGPLELGGRKLPNWPINGILPDELEELDLVDLLVGYNLLKNATGAFQAGADQLTVKFNERIDNSATNQLVVSGLKVADFNQMLGTSAVATGSGAAVWGQTGTAAILAITAAVRAIDSALVTVRQAAQNFGTNSAQLQIRIDFTTNLINTLWGGAAELVNADLNEESANLLSLQTRQELGTVSLSIAQQSEQSILRLF